MSFRKKLLLFFILFYISSITAFTLISLVVIRHILIEYAHEYMENYAKPIIEFYSESYKDIDKKGYSLLEDLESEDIRAFAVDKNGKIVGLEFLWDDLTPINVEVFLKKKRGIYKGYAFITENIGKNYSIVLLFKLDSIDKVQDSIIKSVLLTSSIISLFILFVVPPIVKKFLESLSYLTFISQRISREGPLKVEVEDPKSSDEFGQLQTAYKSMVERLKEVISWQVNFMRDITHALSTPLTYIKGQLELIIMGSYSERELKTVLQKVIQQANRMETLIKRLMLLMRLESQLPLNKRSFSINQLFAELEEEYEFFRETHRFRVEYCSEDVYWEGDYDYIKLAIGNLLENAHKYTPKGGYIRLYYNRGCIVVEDSGISIEDKVRVFEPFYRENSEKEGFGLGLAIVKAVAQRHGLKLSLESEKGKGSKFYLCRVL